MAVSAPHELRVAALYPERLNHYADRGNLIVLERRCRWRGIGFTLTRVSVGDELHPSAHDLYYLGGGQDGDLARCGLDLAATKQVALHEAAARGAVVLGVCGGYQLLGRGYETGSAWVPGAGLVDVSTVAGSPRLVGHAVVEVDLGDGPRKLAGFENHAGRTWLGTDEGPLGRVLTGHGNNGVDRTEGVRRGNVIGTYLHGPLLAANAWLADRLISIALGGVPLEHLDDRFESAVHEAALAAAGSGRG